MKSVKHSGTVLLEEFMKPLGLTANGLALALHVPPQRISEIINGRRGLSAETALRLARLFGTTPRTWWDLQSDYELSQAEEKWAAEINREIQPLATTTTRSTRSAGPSRSGKPGRGGSPGRKSARVKLTDSQRKIYDLLSDTPMHFDVLCRRSSMSAGEVSATITMLELSMLVTCHPGNRFARSGDDA